MINKNQKIHYPHVIEGFEHCSDFELVKYYCNYSFDRSIIALLKCNYDIDDAITYGLLHPSTDVDTVHDEACCTRDEAIDALNSHDGDVINAIRSLRGADWKPPSDLKLH